MILIKVAYCVVWGCVDFKNIKRHKKGSPKFVVDIVTLLRDKFYLVYAGSPVCLFCSLSHQPFHQQQIISKWGLLLTSWFRLSTSSQPWWLSGLNSLWFSGTTQELPELPQTARSSGLKSFASELCSESIAQPYDRWSPESQWFLREPQWSRWGYLCAESHTSQWEVGRRLSHLHPSLPSPPTLLGLDSVNEAVSFPPCLPFYFLMFSFSLLLPLIYTFRW